MKFQFRIFNCSRVANVNPDKSFHPRTRTPGLIPDMETTRALVSIVDCASASENEN